jgi:hypothetical protein
VQKPLDTEWGAWLSISSNNPHDFLDWLAHTKARSDVKVPSPHDQGMSDFTPPVELCATLCYNEED